MNLSEKINNIQKTLPAGVRLVAVSKYHPASLIQEAYDAGQRIFGESHVQELVAKHDALPKDIEWHFIGHLQTNKVRQIIPFVHMIHSVDSLRLLEIINREAEKIQRRVKVLLEVHVAKEETKSGFSPEEFLSLNTKLSTLNNVEICGVMGMATNTDDVDEWRRCFREIKSLASSLLPIAYSEASISSQCERLQISMGMSDDYLIAIEEGSTMVRIGSTIFGIRASKQ
jgi:pyridoxal phosphate enzyme (YggS family)